MFDDKRAEMRTIKALLSRAESVAHEVGDEQPGAEHLLIAAVELADGTARAVFAEFGVDAEQLTAAVVEQHRAALAAVGIDVPARPPRSVPGSERALVGFNDAGRRSFQRAAQLVKPYRPAPFGGAHVVLAVCEQDHGPAARALRTLGIDRATLAAAARARLTAA